MMNRLTKLASNLYPRWWRERYGEEFAALLEDARPGLGGTLDILKGALAMQLQTLSTKRILFIGAAAGFLIGMLTAFFLTPLYASHTIVTVRAPQGTSVVASINQVSQRALSRDALTETIKRYNLYPQERATQSNAQVLETLKRNIRISAALGPSGEGEIQSFDLAFIYPDPAVARQVVNTLVAKFLEENLRAGVATLQVQEAASLAAEPMFPNHRNMAFGGLLVGTAISGMAAVILHFRRKRQAV